MKIAVPILALLILMQTFAKGILLLEYRVNQKYIAEHLCVNRLHPMLHCNGKCQLAKKLNAEEKESNAAALQKLLQEMPPYLIQPLLLLERPVAALSSYTIAANTFAPYHQYIAAIFHPPGR